ncbi:MAG TPA: DUF4922 domain-containing protein [Phycisphaerae bacterium]|nr:DUF4922 domain-containing protein [Phycisphaerae bacterium]
MSKFYWDIEQQVACDPCVDDGVRKLVQRQQEDGFGFPEYWTSGLTIEKFSESYEQILLDRAPLGKRDALLTILAQEKKQSSNLMVEKRRLPTSLAEFGAYKILWRSFRGIGFPGTKRKGDPDAIHDGCFLCLHNTPSRQRGLRMTTLSGAAKHVALMNPFPILENQVTLASLEHEPQELSLAHTLFVLEIAMRSRKFRYTFNGVGAGATIPDHFHFYGFTTPLPLEQSKMHTTIYQKDDSLHVGTLGPNWPVFAIVATGENQRLASFVATLAARFSNVSVAINVLFTPSADGSVYVLPRHRETPSADTGFKNRFGVVEMGGILVAESTAAYCAADAQTFTRAVRDVGYQTSLDVITERFLTDVVKKAACHSAKEPLKGRPPHRSGSSSGK